LDADVGAIGFGLLTAVMFATSGLCSSRSIRMINQASVAAWVMMIGLAVTLPFAIVEGVPDGLTRANTIWLVVSGVGNVGGLLISYAAFRVGKIGVVMPVLSAEGAIAATLSALTGESVAPIAAYLLMFIVVGVVISAVAPDPVPLDHERPVAAVALSTAAAVAFGVSLFATGHISGELPISWLLLPPRIVGVLALAIPLLLMRRLEISRKALPLVVISGLAEVVGFASYVLGARVSVAIASVLASQFALIGALMAFVLFRERLGKLQILGVAILVTGVAGLALAVNT
jgi:drug/metabolite transporter (DMT)-like permease